ncbi:hypothetical protein [Hyphococcus sp.]|uniref:hypothetical protein n=1 Tax=Hyphococcus sp. TaxID=2038636 RepID=UPI003CCB9110
MKEIELIKLTKGEVRNLTGQERGVAARKFFNLDEIDEAGEPVRVVVPDDLDAITTSFFQGMFSSSVRSANSAEAFLDRYRFEARSSIMEQVVRGINRILTPRGSALT